MAYRLVVEGEEFYVKKQVPWRLVHQRDGVAR